MADKATEKPHLCLLQYLFFPLDQGILRLNSIRVYLSSFLTPRVLLLHRIGDFTSN